MRAIEFVETERYTTVLARVVSMAADESVPGEEAGSKRERTAFDRLGEAEDGLSGR